MGKPIYTPDDGTLEAIAKVVLKDYMPAPLVKEGTVLKFQWSDQRKKSGGHSIYADVTMVSDKLKQFTDADYIITFYDAARDMNAKALEILMYHELLHIDSTGEDNKLLPHNVQDFKCILDAFGTEWHRAI